MDALRALLVGPEQEELTHLRRRIDDPAVRAEDVRAVLPDAVRIAQDDEAFAKALSPTIETALRTSVERDPRPLADALFPVLGPAIRRAITQALRGLVQSFNRTLEHSVSWRSLRWRYEAWRTGRSFAEVVLQYTLQYRVEQLFLIHRASGLLIEHVVADEVEAPDADLISGMLSAIQSFVQDSFRVEDGERLETLEVGDLVVWMEPGPYAVVAAVIRGVPPADLREALTETIEDVHLRLMGPLADYDGDPAPLAPCRGILEQALVARYTEPARPNRIAWGMLTLILLASLAWGVVSFRTERRWAAFRAAAAAEPGLVLLRAEQSASPFQVEGLRDPLARDPAEVLLAAGLDTAAVTTRWLPYQALEPQLVERRARQILSPPAGLSLRLDGERLVLAGTASEAWIAAARILGRAVPGVAVVDLGGVVPEGLQQLRTLQRSIEAETLRFDGRTARLADGQTERLRALAAAIEALGAAAGGRDVVLEIIGHADRTASAIVNQRVSHARAEQALRALQAAGLQADTADLTIRVRGVGATEPVAIGSTPEDLAANRRVSFRVLFSDAPSTPPQSEGL